MSEIKSTDRVANLPCDVCSSGPNVVIIGAGGGIGSALIEEYRHKNATLFLSAHSHFPHLQAWSTAQAQCDDFAGVHVVHADLVQEDGPERLAKELTDALRQASPEGKARPDQVAIVSGLDLMTEEARALNYNERMERIWRVDVRATVVLARAFSAMARAYAVEHGDTRPAWRGSMALMGWSGVSRGQEGATSQLYALAKGAVEAFAKALAQDSAPYQRVNVVAPGWIRTTWGAQASLNANRRARAESLMQRWGEAKEVARVLAFVLSEQASFINGQRIVVDGGFDYRTPLKNAPH